MANLDPCRRKCAITDELNSHQKMVCRLNNLLNDASLSLNRFQPSTNIRSAKVIHRQWVPRIDGPDDIWPPDSPISKLEFEISREKLSMNLFPQPHVCSSVTASLVPYHNSNERIELSRVNVKMDLLFDITSLSEETPVKETLSAWHNIDERSLKELLMMAMVTYYDDSGKRRSFREMANKANGFSKDTVGILNRALKTDWAARALGWDGDGDRDEDKELVIVGYEDLDDDWVFT